jgi:two-component system, NarL family, response regulator YdfI
MNGEENTITVFIFASSPIVRAGLEAVLKNDERLNITGSAAEISAAPSLFSSAQAAEVLLINVERKKDYNDLLAFLGDALEPNETDFPFVVALLSTEFQTMANLTNALQNNLHGMLPHDASASEIIHTIKAVAQNLTVLSPEFMEMFLSSDDSNMLFPIGENQIGDDSVEKLTARETQVLELLAEGESNKRIANVLNISEHTVKFHVASVFGKLGATTRTGVVTIALRRGLILL